MQDKENQNNIVEYIYTQMANKITSGEWVVNQRIPTEEELTNMFHASRNSVRQAIARLKALGMLESKRGSGTYVKKAAQSGALLDIISTVMYDIQDKLQVFEFHKGLQIECAKLACLRYTDEQVQELENLMSLMKECSAREDIKAAIYYDLKFHKAICEMSGNIMFVRATELVYQHLEKSFQLIGSSFDYTESIVFHERFLEALRHRNPVFAASVMEAHQWDTYEKYLKLVTNSKN